MIKLIESKLFGAKLFPVETPLMKKRYNECLTEIGLEVTKLSKFHIDGWGWSPEIAKEKDDRFYLSHGIANPFAIIISPKQKNCPLYMPYHTFDWAIHEQMFEKYELQIQDLTSGNGIWVELDQSISAYRNAQDVLMTDVVNVKFNVNGNIQEAAEYQKKLVSQYSRNSKSWMDTDLREKIVASSKLFGDLRYRNLQMPDMPFTNTSTYYTLAFGGLFVFKNLPGGKPLLIYEDNSSEISNEIKHQHVEFNLSDQSFISYLYNLNLLDSEPRFFQDELWLLELQLEHMIVAGAMELDKDTPVDTLTKTQRKGLINKLNKAGLLNERFFDLEILISDLTNGSKKDLKFSEKVNLNLLQPHKDSNNEQRTVLWQLIAKLQSNNPVLLYTFDKSAFYTQYQLWSAPMQRWAIKAIQNNKHVYSRLIDQ